MYGCKNDSNDEVYYNLYSVAQGKVDATTLPTCHHSEMLYAQRANYLKHLSGKKSSEVLPDLTLWSRLETK